MNRTLETRRLYSMGNFNNVEMHDQIIDLPDSLVMNPKAIGLLYYLMILEMEKAHKRYLALYKKFPANEAQMEKAAEIIEEERTKTFTELLNELNKELEPNKNTEQLLNEAKERVKGIV